MRFYLIFCLLLCVCFAVNAQTSPKQLKENTIGTLESINTSSLPKKIRHKIKKKIKRAISFIKESLKFKGQELFLDEYRIVPPPHGKRVFYCEYVAAGILSHKLPKTTPQSIKNTFNQVIADLVLADKLIASHSINNAQMLVDVGEGNAKKLAKAKKKFGQAVNTANPQKAIRRFKDAWALAQKVIKDRKIVILSFNDSPDPFAPQTQTNTLTLTYRIHKFGLYLPRAKRVELETTEVIKNASGVVVRKIVKREQINLPPRRPRNKTFNVTTTLVWDGKDEAGNIVADGQYTYLAFGKLIKVIRRHRREKERVKATSFPVSGTIDVQGSGGDTTLPIISNLQPATGSFIANLKPTISATFSDDNSGINIGSVQILLDATNITSSANVTSSGFSFTPANDLTETNHTVSVTVQDNAGNQAQASTSFTLDVTPPTITASVSPGANGNGWHRENVTVSFSATDSGSGVASVTSDVVVSTEGANQIINGTATDNAGNSANTSITVNLDKTPPVLTSSATPGANNNGWNNTNVDIVFSATDTLSGVDQVTGNTTLTVEGANQQTIGTATDLAGNTATITTSTNIDKTPPTLTSSQTPNANANGWNNTDVAINFAATDALSGVDQINGNTTLTSEGASQQVNGSATDLAGNIANLTATISIDKTAPTITPTASPQPNANGWNNSDTTVSFTVSDLLSGVDQSPSNAIISTEGANQVVNGVVTDLAGNSNSASISINLDKTAPTISSSLSSPANNNGWHKQDVTVSFTGSDSLSGIDQTTPNTLVNTEGANQIINGSATDLAGNSASTSVAINLDKTAPTITANSTPGSNTFGWNNTDVVISFAANDTLSGIDQSTADTTLTNEGANQTIGGSATDKAGNTASTSISANIDKTAPTITASASPAPNANGWNNSDVTVSFASSDALSGIDQSPANVIVNTDGANQVISGNAVDKAGNSASASSTVNLDKIAPVVTLNPASGAFVNTKTPLLVANFDDPTSGADLSTLQITFGGNNITSQAQVIQQGASFQTTTDLADGNHSWQINLSDLAGNTTNASSTFQVSTDPAQTKLIGKVADTNNNPLANVPVSLDANQTTTNANGEFELNTTPGERVLKVDGSAQGFATIAEPIEIKAGVNTLPREIFLPAVDLNTFGIQVSQTQDIILTNPDFPGVEVKIFAGSVKNPDGTPYTGKLMVLQVPRDKTPLALPKDLGPVIVAAIQPGGLTLNPPALLTMPNLGEYPDGSTLNLFSLNPNTGVFENVGTGLAQGNKIITSSGGMNFTAWHANSAPNSDVQASRDKENLSYDCPQDDCPKLDTCPTGGCPSCPGKKSGCSGCENNKNCQCKNKPLDKGNSVVNYAQGNLSEEYTFQGVRFLGKNFAPKLTYNSGNAFPRVNLQFNVGYSNSIKPNVVRDIINFAGIEIVGPARNTFDAQGNDFRIGSLVDASRISSRIVNVNYGSRAGYGSNLGLRPTTTTRDDFFVVVNNQKDSPFGAGWTLDFPSISGGLSRIFPQPLGDILHLQGNGAAKRFVPSQAAGLLCIGNQLWEVVTSTKTVRVYNATTLEILHETIISPTTVGRPFGFVHDPVRKKMYFAIFPGGGFHIEEMDMEDFSVRVGPVLALGGGINSPTTDARKSLVLTANGELVFPLSGRLMRFSADTLEFIATQNVAKATRDSHLKISQDGSTLWMVSFISSGPNVVEVDLNTFNVLRERAFTGSTAFSLTVHEARDELYVTVNEAIQLSIYQLDLQVNPTDPALFAIKRQINFNSNFTTNSLGPAVSLGIGSHIYVNLRDLNTPSTQGTVLKLVDADDGSILNPSLATDLNFIESIPGDPRVFAVGPSGTSGAKIVIIDGETGLLLQESEALFRGGSLLKPESRNQTMFFESPAGDFSVLSFNNNDTENDLTDDFYVRRMKDGTEHKYNRNGLLQEIKDRYANTFTFTYTDANNDGKAEEISSFTTPVGTQYTFTYTSGKISSITDPANKTTNFTHDASGNLTGITKPDNATRSFSYNQKHLMVSQTNERNFTTTYEYDVFGYVKKSNLPDGSVRNFQPEDSSTLVDPNSTEPTIAKTVADSNGERVDGRGNQTLLKTDALGATTQATDAFGKITQMQRDSDSLITQVVDRRGFTTTRGYDSQGNMLNETQVELGITNIYEYEQEFNLVTKHTNPRGAITIYERDNKGCLTKVTDHLGNETSYTYDSRGLHISMTDALGRTTTYTRDSNGNILTITDPNGNPTTYTRDLAGNILTITDELLRVTTFTFDPLNRLLTRTNALNDVASWGYDNYGNNTSYSDENSHVTTMGYDERNQLISRTNPALDTETITRDENLNLIKRVDFKGKITLFQYDKLDRRFKTIRKIGDTANTEDADDIVSTVGYDPEGNVTSTTDALGRKVYQKFDALNRVTQINRKVGDTLDEINADDSVTKFTYDLANNIVLTIDPSNKFVYQDFDLLDRRTKIIQKIGDTANTEDVDDIVTTFGFDGVHNNIKITDGNGKVIYRKFDNLDRLIKVVRKVGDTVDIEDADDAVTVFAYDDVDNLLSRTRPTGIVMFQTYDKLNRVKTRTNGANETDSFEFDPVGNVLKITRANGNVISTNYDVLDRMTSSTDAHGGVISRTYDPVNNVLSETDGNNNTVTYKHDDIHRIVETIDALGKSSFITYDEVSNITQIKDRNNNTTTRMFDDLNRLRTNTDALGFTTTYSYNESSDLVSITDALNQTTTYTYDDIHRKIKTTYADGAEVTLGYDKVHNILSRVDQNGVTTTYSYNDLYFLTQRNYPVDAPDIFSHDKDGRILVATKGDWTCTRGYDGADRIALETQNGKTITKTYDIPNRTFTCTYPNGRIITRVRDKRDRLIQIKDSDNSIISSDTYDPGNRLITCTKENGITRTNSYNNNNWLLGIDHRKTSTNTQVAGFAYTHDNEGNIQTIEDEIVPNFSQKLTLDAIYRIINFKQGQLNTGDIANPNREISFALDGVSNWESKTTNGVAENRTHNNVNEIASINGVAFVHDDNGNLKDDGQKTYKYDTENRLIEVARKSDGRVLVQYQYDAFSRRVRKNIFDPNTEILSKQVEFYCEQESVIEEYEKDADVGGNLGSERLSRQFVDGNNIDEHVLQDIYDGAGNISQSLYYSKNHRGDTSVVTDNAGSVLFRLKYDIYGSVRKLNNQGVIEPFNEQELVVFAFQGRRLEKEIGLYFFRARYLSPSLGRFIQRDAMDYEDSMSLYESFKSNSHRYSDPKGSLVCELKCSFYYHFCLHEGPFFWAPARVYRKELACTAIGGSLADPMSCLLKSQLFFFLACRNAYKTCVRSCKSMGIPAWVLLPPPGTIKFSCLCCIGKQYKWV